MTQPSLPPLDALGEFTRSVWRIVTYASHDLGGEGTCGYLLSEDQVGEIADEANEYARGLAEAVQEKAVAVAVAAERERLRLLPAEALALAVATAQVQRGDSVPPNTAAALLLTINRLLEPAP